MEFKNIENKCYETTCGEKVWKSRNVAVCVCVLRTDPTDSTKIQVLGVQRGAAMTHKGEWCFPCGYLDWNETVPMAAIREVFEETSLEVTIQDLEFLEIDSNPEKFGQNVTIHFDIYYQGDKEPSAENSSKEEVEQVKWLDIDEANGLVWAFDHRSRVNKIVEMLLVPLPKVSE